MSDAEATSRWDDLHNHVNTQTAQAFVTTFLNRCVRANLEHLVSSETEVAQLDVSRLLPRYKHSQKRLLLLDLEGTLWARPVNREAVEAMERGEWEPDVDLINLLTKLSADDRNEAWVLSGLPVKAVLEKIAAKVPAVGLVAENGCFVRPGFGEWINMVSNFNLTWKAACVEILGYVGVQPFIGRSRF